jgi:hypothetical protein
MAAGRLLAAPLLALGLLAGCDLPAGTPAAISPDRVPNDTFEDAVLVPAGRLVTGTVDPNDPADWYRVPPPAEPPQDLYLTCTGRVSFIVMVQLAEAPSEARAAAPFNPLCDGTPHRMGLVPEGPVDIRYGPRYAEDTGPIVPYTARMSYEPPAASE